MASKGPGPLKDPWWVNVLLWLSLIGLVLVFVFSLYRSGVYYPSRCEAACGQLEVGACEADFALCCVGDDCGIKRIR
jgi:hypothetical protein